MEYAVVDKSKKKNRRGGKQQDVSTHARLYYSIVKILYYYFNLRSYWIFINMSYQ